MIDIKSIPFLRILVPYFLGIVCVLQLGVVSHLHLMFCAVFVALGISFLVQRFYKPVTTVKKTAFLICANAFLFLLAFETTYFYNARNDHDHYSHYTEQEEQEFMCSVSDMPVATEKFLKLNVVLEAIKYNGSWHYTSGKSMLYLKNPVAKPPGMGERLFVTAKLGSVTPPQNPNEFDYKTFLERRNLFHVAYADPQKVISIRTNSGNISLINLGISIKEKVVTILRDAGLSQEAFSICTALLVGYDDEISGGVMQSFSHSGTLHVLSVSGMHTGILYIVLLFIFRLFDKYDRYKVMKCVFIIIVLLLFAAITGFSPSVMRAALMLILILVGKTINRHGNSYNTLLFSAFLLLLYDPYLVCDVGFLLSYLAVFGIMYLFPLLNTIYDVRNKFLKFFWDLSLMSVAATVFTLPVTLYYFHQFPTWFIFSNMIIIPLSIGLMATAFLLLLCYKVLIIKQGLVFLINLATTAMLKVAQLTDHTTYGFVDYISFTGADVVFCTLAILLLLRIVATKSYQSVMLGLGCLLLWAGTSLFVNYGQLQENELLVFSVKHKSAWLLRTGHTVYIHADSLSESEFNRNLKPYLLNYSGLTMNVDKSSVLRFNKKSILNACQPYMDAPAKDPDYLIVSNNTPLNLNSTTQIKPLVIADCSNSYTFVKKLKKQCAELGLPFYSIKEQGALNIYF